MQAVASALTQDRVRHEVDENCDKLVVGDQRNVDPRDVGPDDVEAKADELRLCRTVRILTSQKKKVFVLIEYLQLHI